ncbi:carbon-nitrogen hydrolase family protein [Radiobacillus sp. PE A8.2]|uniref:carbon-nitrogen hydrolase family protein n=1 Tax=Radiobacillus sp. PE A8.2 TaxID=3380349 RepID=UPI003890F274
MKIALGQFQPVLGDKAKNLQSIKQQMEQAAEQKADLILFPELCLTGYFIQDATDNLAEPVNGESVKQVQKWSKELNLYAVFTWPELKDDGLVYNSASLISNTGDIVGIYRKVHLYDEEKLVFTPGERFKAFDTELGKIGLIICFDLDFPESIRSLKIDQADIVLCSTNNMEPYQDYQEAYLKSRSMENEIPVAICNRIGTERDLTFFGESAIYSERGKNYIKLAEHPVTKTVEVPIRLKTDPNLQYVNNRRPVSYQLLSK